MPIPCSAGGGGLRTGAGRFCLHVASVVMFEDISSRAIKVRCRDLCFHC